MKNSLCHQIKEQRHHACQEHPIDTTILHLFEKVGESSASVGASRNTPSSSGLPESACMALRGRVKSLSQLSLGGVQGTGLVQRGRNDKWREDRSLQPKHTTNCEGKKYIYIYI